MIHLFHVKSRTRYETGRTQLSARHQNYPNRVPQPVQNFWPGAITFPQDGFGHLAGCGGASATGGDPTARPQPVQNFLPGTNGAPQAAQTAGAGACSVTASNLPPQSAQKTPEAKVSLQFTHCNFAAPAGR